MQDLRLLAGEGLSSCVLRDVRPRPWIRLQGPCQCALCIHSGTPFPSPWLRKRPCTLVCACFQILHAHPTQAHPAWSCLNLFQQPFFLHLGPSLAIITLKNIPETTTVCLYIPHRCLLPGHVQILLLQHLLVVGGYRVRGPHQGLHDQLLVRGDPAPHAATHPAPATPHAEGCKEAGSCCSTCCGYFGSTSLRSRARARTRTCS